MDFSSKKKKKKKGDGCYYIDTTEKYNLLHIQNK